MSDADLLSWVFGSGFIKESMEGVGHTDYFIGDNLLKLIEIINKYIGECP